MLRKKDYALRHPYQTRAKARIVSDIEQVQEQMKADMEAMKKQMLKMLLVLLLRGTRFTRPGSIKRVVQFQM